MKIADACVVFSGVLVLLQALYVSLLYALSRSKPECRVKRVPGGSGPSLAIACAAYNEPIELLKRQAAYIACASANREIEYHMVWDGPHCLEAVKAVEEVLSGSSVSFSYKCREAKLGKASALNEVASRVKSEYLLVLDADDYIDSIDGVLEALRGLKPNDAGLVLRWVPQRASEGLQEALAALIDYGMRVLYAARCRLGLPVLYVGSGSIIKTGLVRRLGGWRTDMLLEDLDLGIRMVLQGYNMRFDEELGVVVGVPPTLLAFARQQQRWAEGALQLLRHYAPSLLLSEHLNLKEKLEIIMYLSQYTVSSLAIALLMVGCLLGPGSHASWASFTLWAAALGFNGAPFIRYLRRERGYPFLKGLRLGGAGAAASAVLWLRLLLYSAKGLLFPGRSWLPTPKRPLGRFMLSSFWPEGIGFLVALAATIRIATCTGLNPLVLLTAAYVVGPLYLVTRFRRETS